MDLNKFGVAEMDKNEMAKVDGGILGWIIVGGALLLLNGCAAPKQMVPKESRSE